MQDVPNSISNSLKADLEDILDPDERTNDVEEERRAAEHDSEFYDGDRDQDGDTMPLPPLSSRNGASMTSSSGAANNGPWSGADNPGGGTAK